MLQINQKQNTMTRIEKSTFNFLNDITRNNNREWFTENKPHYQTALANFKAFMETIVNKMSFHDEIEGNKSKVFRIYRDVRFSKNKTPYKINLSAGMQRASKLRRGGYYISLQPNNTFVGGGFFQPEKEDLKRIRQDIATDAKTMRSIIADTNFQELFGEMNGDQLKTAPRDFPKDHPDIDLIRHKSFIVRRSFTDEEVLAENFAEEVVRTYIGMRPFFDYMTEVLTTDGNGELIV